MKQIWGLGRGMGIGGWLTNYKRFNVLPKDKRMDITIGDMEHFESYITEEDISYIASLGMDHVRLGFDQIVLEESPFVYRERTLELVKSFTLWCKKYGLRPILNMHKALGNYCDILDETGLMESRELQARFIALWLKLEEVFRDRDDVAFELLNEVVNATPEQWNELAERTLFEIRKKNPGRLVIIGTADWNNPPTLPRLRVYDDKNVIYTFHCYAPHEFTHQRGVLQEGPLYYNRDMPYPSDDVERYREYHRLRGRMHEYEQLTRIDIDYLREYLSPVKDFIAAHPDKIIWCGEFGTIRHAKLLFRENWMRDMITVLKEMSVPYCVWNYLSTPNDGNRFSLVDDDTRKILSPELERIIRGDL